MAAVDWLRLASGRTSASPGLAVGTDPAGSRLLRGLRSINEQWQRKVGKTTASSDVRKSRRTLLDAGDHGLSLNECGFTARGV